MHAHTQPQFVKAFARHLADQGRSERTIEAYLGDLRGFCRWFAESNGAVFSAGELTATDVRDYRAYLLRRKAAPATINRALATLRTFAEWAVAGGHLHSNPIDRIKGVEEQPHAPKWLEKKQQSALLRLLERDVNAATTEAARRRALRDQAMVVLMLNTGLRVGEACGLELSDVAISERKGVVLVREGKGSKRREVPLNGEARRVLAAWLKARPAGCEHVFVGQRGEPLQPRAVQRMLADLGRRAGVEVTPHSLRHSFAKNLLNAGVPMEKAAALLGHANLNTTRVYVTPGAEDLQEAVQAIG